MLYRQIAEMFPFRGNESPFSFRANTTVGIGGTAPLALFPETEEDCVRAVRFLEKEGVPYVLLGNGSNVLVSDKGFDGAVICTRRMKTIRADVCGVYAESGAALDADTLTPGGTVTARVTVKNSGAMRGAEVVQLYVADATGAPVPGGRVPQALRRFAKIDLQPGEEREIVFTLTPQDISRYSPELHAWCAAPGRYEIRIGHSSRDIRAVLALQYADAKI